MSWLKNLFQKNDPVPEVDFSVLRTDIHSHLIPGIDDGAKTMEESLALIRGLHELGYRRLVTTPHVMSDYYPNTRSEILRGLARVQRAVQQAGLDIQIDAAAEYYLDEQFEELLEKEELLTLPGGRYVLIEMGFIAEPPNLYDYLFRLQTKGYYPILAHPERYTFYQGDLETYRKLQRHGCTLQVNLLSLTGHYGSGVQRTADKLLKADIVDFLGTDLHHRGHLRELQEALQTRKLTRLLTEEEFLNEAIK